MKYLTGETQEDVEDRAMFHIPPTPPVLCPSCDRESCLLWKAERLRRVQARAAQRAEQQARENFRNLMRDTQDADEWTFREDGVPF